MSVSITVDSPARAQQIMEALKHIYSCRLEPSEHSIGSDSFYSTDRRTIHMCPLVNDTALSLDVNFWLNYILPKFAGWLAIDVRIAHMHKAPGLVYASDIPRLYKALVHEFGDVDCILTVRYSNNCLVIGTVITDKARELAKQTPPYKPRYTKMREEVDNWLCEQQRLFTDDEQDNFLAFHNKHKEKLKLSHFPNLHKAAIEKFGINFDTNVMGELELELPKAFYYGTD